MSPVYYLLYECLMSQESISACQSSIQTCRRKLWHVHGISTAFPQSYQPLEDPHMLGLRNQTDWPQSI